jgi:hypothetical protein
MTNKNPFEIRADILEMAKDYMDKQTALNLQYWEKMLTLGQATMEDVKAAYTPYTMEDLTKKAQEMYSFVSNKDAK